MKFCTVAALSALCLLFLFSNAKAQVADATKIAVINSDKFMIDKTGITKYLVTIKSLEAEFAPLQRELQTMATKLETLKKEIEALSKQAATGTGSVGDRAVAAKVDEAEALQGSIRSKQEQAQASYSRRSRVVLGPVMDDIAKALTDFAKIKGYALIFDQAKDREGLLIVVGNQKADVTAEFITFYNVR